ETVFRAHLDDVAEALRGHERRSGATALDERIGGERRAVDDDIDIAQRDARIPDDDLDTIEDRLLGGGIIGQHLGGKELAAHIERDVGKGAADIGAEADVVTLCHAVSFAERAALRIWLNVWRGLSASGEMA